MDSHQKIILFDGVCNLCNKSVQFVLAHDRKQQFVFGSLQGKVGTAYLEQFKLPSNDLSSFLLVDEGILYTQSTAALRVLKQLGGGWQLLYAFIVVPRFIRDAVYDWISRNRYKWFGKMDSCWLPSPQWKNRFLE